MANDIVKESIPVFVQIAEGIKDYILSGDIKEGEQIMSTIQMSKNYNISPATAAKGINILVADGIVFKKKGIGMFVAEGAVEKLVEDRRKVFKEKYIDAMLIEAKRLRYTANDLQKMVVDSYEAKN